MVGKRYGATKREVRAYEIGANKEEVTVRLLRNGRQVSLDFFKRMAE